jgi:SAM-dependent methyltransferase
MNRIHRWYCSSNHWKRFLKKELFPRVFSGFDLGNDVLEIGPGPGLTTELLLEKCERLTCLEIDPAYAEPLRRHMKNANVTVVEGDATRMDFEDGRFSGVVSLSMMHHVPSPSLQDRLFHEVYRVLRPGGIFNGVDSRQSWGLRLFHWGDTFVPIDPDRLEPRLRSAGFSAVVVTTEKRAFRFVAGRPL